MCPRRRGNITALRGYNFDLETFVPFDSELTTPNHREKEGSGAPTSTQRKGPSKNVKGNSDAIETHLKSAKMFLEYIPPNESKDAYVVGLLARREPQCWSIISRFVSERKFVTCDFVGRVNDSDRDEGRN